MHVAPSCVRVLCGTLRRAVGWEKFQYLQIIGFLLLLSGTFVYNEVIIAPLLRRYGFLAPKQARVVCSSSCCRPVTTPTMVCACV